VARSVEPAVQNGISRALSQQMSISGRTRTAGRAVGLGAGHCQDGGELLYEKNANAVVPIASITKLMTAMVVLDSMPNLQAPITISDEDVDYLRGSRSRLRQVGTVITRETALLLALMSSENRAANALGRHYPGGLRPSWRR
jgi:hypothetical protein